MPSRGITRGATIKGIATPTHTPIYTDSDDNIVKMIPAGSGTTEVQIIDASSTQTLTNKTLTSPVVGGDLGLTDDVSLELGTDDDTVIRHKSASLTADTALTDVLIGTPVTEALAANSTIISNVTASGDILIAANRGGASEAYVWIDSSAGELHLTGYAGGITLGLAADQPAPDLADPWHGPEVCRARHHQGSGEQDDWLRRQRRRLLTSRSRGHLPWQLHAPSVAARRPLRRPIS